MKSFANLRVSVFGVGKSGMAAVRVLVREGARVTAVDQQPLSALFEQSTQLAQLGVPLVGGLIPSELLEAVDLLIVSPGVSLALPEIRRAYAAGVKVWSEVELASRLLPPAALKVGITGTNGKSTTTALTGELFSQGGRRTFVGGNLGRPWCEAVLEGTPFDAHVLELSSFQLESTQTLRLRGAALLNLTPDHLDRYAGFEEYGAAKARIFLHQGDGDFAVVNADDQAVTSLARALRVPVYAFSVKGPGALAPFAGGACARAGFEIHLPSLRSESYSIANRALRGAHNLQNAMAAGLLARLCGIDAASIQRGLDSFPGLPHRLEWVRTFQEIDWINDSKATNVDSTVVALNALDAPIYLIAGGRGKGAPYAPMVRASIGKVKGVLTIGEDAKKIEQAFSSQVPVHPCHTLDQAVGQALRMAEAKSVVLLSPACASYDQFRNFEHRGDAFKSLVRAL